VSRTLHPDDQISHFRVVGLLGAGGMGEVYAARDEKLERNVALKVLPPGLVRNEERVRRFIAEAKSASSLNHPNIVTIYEIGHDVVKTGDPAPEASVHFISMELVTGETLTRKIHVEKEDLRALVGYIAQAAEGVARAHAAGIVHRDLKPGNILVADDGLVKVLDFGLAKLVERQPGSESSMTSAPTEAPHTGEGVVMGTVGYMSPEQVQAKPTDHRSDIFSMGCILYEAATRRRPFDADTDVEIMHRILKDDPRPVEAQNPAAPTEVRKLIRRCLAKNADQRFQSMKDLAMDLREIVEEWDSLGAAATAAGSLTPGALTAPPARRKTSTLGIVAASGVGLAVLALGLYAFLGARIPGPSSALASRQMKIATLMSRDALDSAVLSSDGRYLAYVAIAGDRSSLNIRQVRTGSDAQILAPQEFPIQGISFSPDGDYLYFRNVDPALPNYQALFQVPSLGGVPKKVAFDVDTAVSFSPDGKRFCFRRGHPDQDADALIIMESETGKERELIRIKQPASIASPAGPGAMAWSPDGKRIAVSIFDVTGGAHTRIATIDVASGERTDVGSQSWLFVDGLAWLPDGSAILHTAFALGSRGYQIYRLSFPGGDVRRLTNDLDGYRGLSLSADGRSIAATRETGVANVWVAPLDAGGDPHPITFASGSATVEFIAPLADGGVAFSAAKGERNFLWRVEPDGSGQRQLNTDGVYVENILSPRGEGIVFTQVGENAILHLFRVNSDGTGLRQITDGPGESLFDVSPDGQTVLFAKFDDSTAVWTLRLDGGEPRRFIAAISGRDVNFSPDGQKILYTTFENTERGLYPKRIVVPSGGGESLASFALPPGAANLQWAPDGQAVTYIDRATGFNLMRRSLTKSDPEQLTRFIDGRLRGHAWSPDGRRVLLHRRLGKEDSLWVLEPGAHGPPAMLTGFKTGEIFKFSWARDSRSAVFAYGSTGQDVVLMSEFD
jgi:Tol biopolymer transport system component